MLLQLRAVWFSCEPLLLVAVQAVAVYVVLPVRCNIPVPRRVHSLEGLVLVLISQAANA